MTEKIGVILVSLVIGCALNPLICWAWAKLSDWWSRNRPAVWGYRAICDHCGNAPERRADVKFRERRPRARRFAQATKEVS